ncbi:hypothetical protein [Aquisalimonas sp.]|uniref:hypothetical protein n=1 Tax=Aquisalimonas sp. TaxID=1872621 RepID=UPI0025C22793|nr:hypothetical protein [Aquisalimonas sp.]
MINTVLRSSLICMATLLLVACPRQSVVVTISPTSVPLAPGEQQEFIATVAGTEDPRVTWEATGGHIEEISDTVNFTAKAEAVVFTAPEEAGEYTLSATSRKDPSRSATATITVEDGIGTGAGRFALRYDGLPQDTVSMLTVRSLEVDGDFRRVELTGPAGEVLIELPAGEHEARVQNVVGMAGDNGARNYYTVEGSSNLVFRLDVDETVERSVSFSSIGEVAESVKVLSGGDLDDLIAIDAAGLRFSERPAVLEDLEKGDVLYLRLPQRTDLDSLFAANAASPQRWLNWGDVRQSWDDFGAMAAEIPHVVLDMVEDSTGLTIHTAPANLVSLLTRIELSEKVKLDELPLMIPSGSAVPFDGALSGGIVLRDVVAHVEFRARRVITPPRNYWNLDDAHGPLAIPDATCYLQSIGMPPGTGWVYVALAPCPAWLVVEELLIDVQVGEFDLGVSINVPTDDLKLVLTSLPILHKGTFALVFNLDADLIAKIPAVSLSARQPLSFRSHYVNTGAGGKFEEQEGSQIDITPSFGDRDGNLSKTVSGLLSPALAITDPTMISQLFGRIGAGVSVAMSAGDPLQTRDVWPFTVSGIVEMSAGKRFVWRSTQRNVFVPAPWRLFDIPLLGDGKLHFEGLGKLPADERIYYRELGSDQRHLVTTPFVLVSPHEEHEVWVEAAAASQTRLTPSPDSCDIVGEAADGTSARLGPQGIQKICEISLAISPPELSVSPASISGTAPEQGSVLQQLNLTNSGGAPLLVSEISTDADWLDIVPPGPDSIAPNQTVVVNVTLDASALAAASYEATILLTWAPSNASSASETIAIPVSFLVISAGEHHRLFGQVTDEAGIPISDVVVSLEVGGIPFAATTDDAGRYDFTFYKGGLSGADARFAKTGYTSVIKPVDFTFGAQTELDAVLVPISADEILFYEGFETCAAEWLIDNSAGGLWNCRDYSAIQNQAYVEGYSNLIAGDNTDGFVPYPYAGSHSFWYGDPTTGNFIGEQHSDDTQNTGGTSVGPNRGQLISPTIDLSTVSEARLEGMTWYEVESVDIAQQQYDQMQIRVYTGDPTNDGVWQFTRWLNPPFEPPLQQPDLPYTSGGNNRPAIWVPFALDLTAVAGHPDVHVVFHFETVDHLYNGFRGWLLDEIYVLSGAGPQSQVWNYGIDSLPQNQKR